MNLLSFKGPNAPAGRAVGANAIARAMAAGHSRAAIAQAMQSQNIGAGHGVREVVGPSVQAYNPAQHKGNDNIWEFYDGTKYSTGWGQAAQAAANQSGMSDAQVRSQLASSGLAIGQRAADVLNVNPVQTRKDFPDHVKDSYNNYKTRAILTPKGASVGGIVYSAGGYSDADIVNNYSGNRKHGEWGTYQDPDWENYVGAGIYDPNRGAKMREAGEGYEQNAIPSLQGAGRPSGRTTELKGTYDIQRDYDPVASYQDTFNQSVSNGGGTPTQAPVGSIGAAVKAVAEEPTSVAPAPGDVTSQAIVEPIKVQAEAKNDIKQLGSNVGKLTSGRIRDYYSSRF